MYPYGEHMGGWGYALGIIGMVLFWAVLVLIGSFFRGPGQNFVLPWKSGIFFDL